MKTYSYALLSAAIIFMAHLPLMLLILPVLLVVSATLRLSLDHNKA